jgi:hypothetical protein
LKHDVPLESFSGCIWPAAGLIAGSDLTFIKEPLTVFSLRPDSFLTFGVLFFFANEKQNKTFRTFPHYN